MRSIWMKTVPAALIAGLLMSFTVVTGCQKAQKSPVETLVNTVATGCEKELKSYCSQVTPGEGRVLACLYSHGEKLSGRCEYALYDASAQLERFIAGLSHVAHECKIDIKQYCSTEIPGEGRILKCLVEENGEVISKRCSRAIKDVGLEVELVK